MCVILACDEKTGKPTKKMLKEAENMNDDGGSIAWIKGNKVRWEKGLKAKQIYKIVKKVNLPMVIHFRIATHGGVNKALCHPFPITDKVELFTSGSADSVLFHNGIWSEYNKYALTAVVQHKIKFPSGKMSDSRAMAWLVSHFGKSILNLMGDGNKMCILTKKGIEYFGKGWCKVDDIKCSNDHFDNTYDDNDTYQTADEKQTSLMSGNVYDRYETDSILYDDSGEMSEFDIDECQYNRQWNCYVSPNNEYLYTSEALDQLDYSNTAPPDKMKWKNAQDDLEDLTPINHLNAKQSREADEADEWENRGIY